MNDVTNMRNLYAARVSGCPYGECVYYWTVGYFIM